MQQLQLKNGEEEVRPFIQRQKPLEVHVLSQNGYGTIIFTIIIITIIIMAPASVLRLSVLLPPPLLGLLAQASFRKRPSAAVTLLLPFLGAVVELSQNLGDLWGEIHALGDLCEGLSHFHGGALQRAHGADDALCVVEVELLEGTGARLFILEHTRDALPEVAA